MRWTFCFLVRINTITSLQALASNHWKAVSCLSLSSSIWVGTADMLSEVSAPCRDTHHYHHHFPLPPSLSVCLCLSRFVSSNMLPLVDGTAVAQLTHNSGWGEGGQHGSTGRQGGTAPISTLQFTDFQKRKVERCKHRGH